MVAALEPLPEGEIATRRRIFGLTSGEMPTYCVFGASLPLNSGTLSALASLYQVSKACFKAFFNAFFFRAQLRFCQLLASNHQLRPRRVAGARQQIGRPLVHEHLEFHLRKGAVLSVVTGAEMHRYALNASS